MSIKINNGVILASQYYKRGAIMEIKIDLDLNKIDYDAINKQIVEKIADMDLAANFKYKIENRINEEVELCVSDFFRTRRWGELNFSSQKDMQDMLYDKARELINPHVTNIISQVSDEEFNKIIADLIPKVLVDLLTSHLKSVLYSYYDQSSETIINEATNRIRSCLY